MRCLTVLGLVLNLFTHMWISKNPVEMENLQNVGIIIQDLSMILFASTDFPWTINGNAPGEENNGGALWRNKGEKGFLVVKTAGAVRLPFSWYIRDAATNSQKNRITMNGALHSSLFQSLVIFQGIVSFTLPVVGRFWPRAFDSSLKLLSNDAPSQDSPATDWNCRFMVVFSATDHNRPWPAAKPVFREVK